MHDVRNRDITLGGSYWSRNLEICDKINELEKFSNKRNRAMER